MLQPDSAGANRCPKQPISLVELEQFDYLDQVIIESIEQALFRLEVVVADQAYYVIDKPGKSLTRRSIIDMQSLLTAFRIGKMYLRHSSPYDEMIGHEVNQNSNELLVPLGNAFENLMDDKLKATQH